MYKMLLVFTFLFSSIVLSQTLHNVRDKKQINLPHVNRQSFIQSTQNRWCAETFYQLYDEGFSFKTWNKKNQKIINDTIAVKVSSLSEKWDTLVNAWVILRKFNYTYDGNGNETEYLSQSWNGSSWLNSYRGTSTYDSNGNVTEFLGQTWIGSWVNNYRITYTYDGYRRRTEYLGQTWFGGIWENSFNITYTYDVNGNETESLSQAWNGSTWVNPNRAIYTYNGNGNKIESLSQRWNDSIWVNTFRGAYTYDSNGNETEELIEYWNGSAWVNSGKYTYTYDVNRNETESLSQAWNGSTWVNSSRETYTWQQLITDVKDEDYSPTTFSLSQNYPNPFNPTTVIQYSVLGSQYVSLKVFDVLGREIATLVDGFQVSGFKSQTWEASGVPSGVYYYRLQVGEYSETKKMVIAK